MSGDHNAHQNDFHPDWDTVKAFDVLLEVTPAQVAHAKEIKPHGY